MMPTDNITIQDILDGCTCAPVELAGSQTCILNVACPVHSRDPLAQEQPREWTPEQKARFERLWKGMRY